MKKKILFLLCILIVFTFTACGKEVERGENADMKEKLKGMMGRDKIEEMPVDLPEDVARTEEKTEESAGGEPAEDTTNLDETEGEKKVEEFEDQN